MIPPGIYRRRLTSKSDGKCQFVPARNGGECFEGALEVFMEFFSKTEKVTQGRDPLAIINNNKLDCCLSPFWGWSSQAVFFSN